MSSRSCSPSAVSSFDPQLLKRLFSGKEYLSPAAFYTQPPPNAVASNLPRHLLGNGLSKLNSEKPLEPVDPPPKKRPVAVPFDPWLQPPPGSLIQRPPCFSADTVGAELSSSEALLSSGERIRCFSVGGERRLCLPAILNSVLAEFSLGEINEACERLHIYCSRCSPAQLASLKRSGVLPSGAPSCGLITLTDAERLCAALLRAHLRPATPPERLAALKVQHKCFGRCAGTFYPAMYVAAEAECIQCESCRALFSPRSFVAHGHQAEENRICHWGFDAENWRAYLKSRSSEDRRAREELERLKEKFRNPTDNSTNSSSLRVVCCTSPSLEQRSNPAILNFTDFSSHGIRQMVESSVSSCEARQHLLSYIVQLQQAALHSQAESASNETVLLRRENELLRERLSKYQESVEGESGDSEAEPAKYFDRKRRLLAGEASLARRGPPGKRTCLEQIVDCLNQRAAQEIQVTEEELRIDE